ncbi:MAG: hypothetical protein R3B06_31665 [Kofleriaceae bacterium]
MRSGADGVVTSMPAGVACGATCTARFPLGTVVTLRAEPPAGVTFVGWGGACSGTLPTCSFVVVTDVAVDAAFGVERHQLTVTVDGNASGTVTSTTPAGLVTCPGTCTATVDHGTAVALTAAPGPGAAFLGWSGACTGPTCMVTVDRDLQVSAAFGQSQSLVVTKSGAGTGTVTSTPAGINCGADCDQVYPPGTVVTLQPMADPTSVFVSWSGACSGAGACTVTVDAATAVNARFDLRTYTLAITRTGTGGGTVTSTPSGIACGTNCSADFPAGATVTLAAQADGASTFAGWSGACTGMATTCTVTMSQARSATARFDPSPTQTLTLTVYGPGTATATPSPMTGPAACSSSGTNTNTCTLVYPTSATVTVTASPMTTFVSMFGCAVMGMSCQVSMSAARSVTTYFCGPGDPCPL